MSPLGLCPAQESPLCVVAGINVSTNLTDVTAGGRKELKTLKTVWNAPSPYLSKDCPAHLGLWAFAYLVPSGICPGLPKPTRKIASYL